MILDLATDLPPVHGGTLDLRRLLTFLLGTAAAAAAPVGGGIAVVHHSRQWSGVLARRGHRPSGGGRTASLFL